MARSKIPIDERKVEELAALGCSVEEIGALPVWLLPHINHTGKLWTKHPDTLHENGVT